MELERHSYDVVVIGAGGTGFLVGMRGRPAVRLLRGSARSTVGFASIFQDSTRLAFILFAQSAGGVGGAGADVTQVVRDS